MAIESIEQLLAELREHPEWREQVRAVVLGEHQLALPEVVDRLAVVQERTQQHVDALVASQQRTQQQLDELAGRVDVLAQRMDAMAGRMDALAEAQEATEVRLQGLAARMDALAAAQEATEVRLQGLAARMDALAEAQEATEVRLRALAERMDTFAQRMDALAERMDALAAAQETTEVRLQGLAEQLSMVAGRADRAIGYLVEQQYRGKAHAYFQTIARRIRMVSLDRLDDLLDAALAAGSVTEVEAGEVRWADAVLQGRRDGDPVFLVLEASAVVDTDDVERAARRSAVVGRLGAPSLAIAAGEKILPEAAAAARRLGVWLVTDGHVEAPAA
jgi:chaperonin cofactor prefoldin